MTRSEALARLRRELAANVVGAIVAIALASWGAFDGMGIIGVVVVAGVLLVAAQVAHLVLDGRAPTPTVLLDHLRGRAHAPWPKAPGQQLGFLLLSPLFFGTLTALFGTDGGAFDWVVVAIALSALQLVSTFDAAAPALTPPRARTSQRRRLGAAALAAGLLLAPVVIWWVAASSGPWPLAVDDAVAVSALAVVPVVTALYAVGHPTPLYLVAGSAVLIVGFATASLWGAYGATAPADRLPAVVALHVLTYACLAVGLGVAWSVEGWTPPRFVTGPAGAPLRVGPGGYLREDGGADRG